MNYSDPDRKIESRYTEILSSRSGFFDMAIAVKRELPKLFCTVLREFKADGMTPIWEVNKTLQNRLENLLEKQPALVTEDECTVRWIDIYRDQQCTKPQTKLVESFLCYYLQQIAYQVANKTYNSAVVGMSRAETGTYKKDELFAIANAKIPKVIQNFNPNTVTEFTSGSGSRLGAYAYQVFRNAIRAAISLQQIDRLSDWGLLVYGVSPSYLIKALREQGMEDAEISYHRAVLCYIGEVYMMKNDPANAEKYLTKGLIYLRKNKRDYSYLIQSHNLANFYGMNGDFDKAFKLDNEGIIISDGLKSEKMKTKFLNNKANCFMYSGQLDSAKVYFDRSMIIDLKVKDSMHIADTYANYAQLDKI